MLRRLRNSLGDGPGEAAIAGGGESVLFSRGSIRHVAFYRVPPLEEAAASPLAAERSLGDQRRDPRSFGQTVVFSDVRLNRGGRNTLAGIDLVLDERRIGVLGLNGSGKSSLLKLMVGLIVPTSGSVSVDGLSPSTDAAAVRTRTGFLFQSADNQIVYPIVREDLAFGLEGNAAEVDAAIMAALDRLGIARLADRRIHELSGGERQLIALAGVLARHPRTILFDEPTSQLDLANRNRLRDVLADLPQQAVVVTHDLDLVAGFDRVLVVDGGRIVSDGSPGDVVAFYRRRHG
ncbi:cobalt ABC transporter ATP-binding protein (plasmid) [Azospirillum humicireducens]|uniref:Cobalt ABC transporter ATP-binding protein n=2 Tax=Azospirillum humicireducens TaxID=1226968 RepID=A0A2R4VU07_9PROT|nr:cobalt ABC transporter ATP-binding protein [Azospirillum humicireducens]